MQEILKTCFLWFCPTLYRITLTGCHKGNGEELLNSQVEPGQSLKSAVA